VDPKKKIDGEKGECDGREREPRLEDSPKRNKDFTKMIKESKKKRFEEADRDSSGKKR